MKQRRNRAKGRPKKAKHQQKYRELSPGLFVCRCSRALALGFGARGMLL